MFLAATCSGTLRVTWHAPRGTNKCTTSYATLRAYWGVDLLWLKLRFEMFVIVMSFNHKKRNQNQIKITFDCLPETQFITQ